jgi:hypothetical protein
VELYFRNVTAVNGTVVFDRERLAGVGGTGADGGRPNGGQAHYNDFAPAGKGWREGGAPRVFMGRMGGDGMERTNEVAVRQRPMRRAERRGERWG